MLEEHENQETSLQDLIDLVERDDLPTNEFTIQDKDPMVILGKLNDVIAYLKTLDATISSSDSKATEALQKAIQAVADATQALSVANGIDAKATKAMEDALEALNTANEALSNVAEAVTTAQSAESKADTAISTANSATTTANSASSTAQSADTKADTAITTANGAKTTAEGIDAKATNALSNSQTAVSSANIAETKATQALATANTADTTANTANDTANTALTNSSNALTTSDEANTKATTALNTSNNALNNANDAINTANGANTKADTAITTSNEAKATANDAKRTAEEALTQVVTGLGTKVYRDSQLLNTLDIKPIEDNIANNATAINNEATTRANAVNALDNAKVDKVAGKQLSTEDFTTAEKNKLAGLNNYDDTQVQADITALQNGKANQSDLNTTNSQVDTNTRDITSLTNNKANNDLSNVTYPSITAGSTTSGSGDRVVEQYLSSDGQTWYRKWASGWKECGMFYQSPSISLSSVASKDIGLIALPITFSNTNYNVQCTTTWTASAGHQFVFDTSKTNNTNDSIFLAVTRVMSSGSASPACFITCAGY